MNIIETVKIFNQFFESHGKVTQLERFREGNSITLDRASFRKLLDFATLDGIDVLVYYHRPVGENGMLETLWPSDTYLKMDAVLQKLDKL